MSKLSFTAVFAIVSLGASAAAAQPYPTRPLRIIVPFAPGGGSDTLARILGHQLTQQIGQQVIVDNRPGGAGMLGMEIAKNAPPDGYTLLTAGGNSMVMLPALKRTLPYDADKDYIPLTRISSSNNLLLVNPSLGVATVADLVQLAKARPGQLNYGSSGNGSHQHLSGAMFNLLAGVKTVHVPYKSGLLNDLFAGHIHFVVYNPIGIMPHAKAGRVKVIASAGATRDPFFPELPVISETLPGFEATAWTGVAVPAKTPAAIVDKLHTEIVKALLMPSVREQIANQSATPRPESPAEFVAFIKADRERIARVGKQAGIALD